MFYNRGEVISDQFGLFQVFGFRVSVGSIWKKIGKNKIIWEFFLEGGGGPPIPKCILQNTNKK